MIKVVILSSLKQEEDIKNVKKGFEELECEVVFYPKKQENRDIQDIIAECFDKIDCCDFVYVIHKYDGTIGNGVSYEMEYAKRKGKKILHRRFPVEKGRRNY